MYIIKRVGSTNCFFIRYVVLIVLIHALFTTVIFASPDVDRASSDRYQIEITNLAVAGIPFKITITTEERVDTKSVAFILNGESVEAGEVEQDGNQHTFKDLKIDKSGFAKVAVSIAGEIEAEREILVIPGIITLLPPILAIVLALIFRQVIIALTTGVWLGATIAAGYDPLIGIFNTIAVYIKNSIADPDRISILLFTTLLGGMIGVISKSGGTHGVVNRLKKIARNPKRSQIATWAMGLFIFFDDYSNTLIVGNTMRPITDKMRVSREKLSYIVDSTAAPVTSIAVVTTWVGFQISLIAGSFQSLGVERSPFITFVSSVPFQFYSILALFFVFFIGFTGRDYGPMLKAEIRARSTGKVMEDDAMPLADFSPEVMTPPKGAPLRWFNAVIPILFVIFGTLTGLIISGKANLESKGVNLSDTGFFTSLKDIFAAADSFNVLLIVSFLGCIVAITLAVVQKILSPAQSMEALIGGFKSMLMALIILILAGSIGDICADLKTADYISDILREGFSIYWLPAATFIVAAFISFSTGTSWGTMSILTPLVIPLAYKLGESLALPITEIYHILLITIASIMGGAVFGDHSSPISDTTIMSSIASASDHIHHVKTQIPYASVTAIVSLMICLIPASFWNFSPLLSIPLAAIILFLFIYIFGRKSDQLVK